MTNRRMTKTSLMERVMMMKTKQMMGLMQKEKVQAAEMMMTMMMRNQMKTNTSSEKENIL